MWQVMPGRRGGSGGSEGGGVVVVDALVQRLLSTSPAERERLRAAARAACRTFFSSTAAGVRGVLDHLSGVPDPQGTATEFMIPAS